MDSHSTGDDFFNDLSQQPPSNRPVRRPSARNENGDNLETNNDGEVLKPKRIACVLCRRRKLKCDGIRPSCGTCARLGHSCMYDEARKKSGPKRGYVKLLEARLAQVETLLNTQPVNEGRKSSKGTVPTRAFDQTFSEQDLTMSFGHPDFAILNGGMGTATGQQQSGRSYGDVSPLQQQLPSGPVDTFRMDLPAGDFEKISWEMIGLGLEEPLPSPDVTEELTQIYFDKIHPWTPMIHRPRFMAALDLPPNMRPPVCLRYAMWCLAASVSDKYSSCQSHFYEKARKYVQLDEMKGHGEGFMTLAHSQSWTLIAGYEFKVMYFPRAWMSVGRAARLAQMLGLQRMDGAGVDVKQCLPPPRDFTEKEERRRTYWMAFCQDRCASIGTGWPMAIEETDIMTYLPASEEAYLRGQPEDTMTLNDAMKPAAAQSLSSFAAVVVMANLFGRNLTHLHRPGPEDEAGNLNGPFWKRHRAIDKILSDIALSLPDHLRIPSGLPDVNVVFVNMNLHTSTICLHQAAISKAEKCHLPAQVRLDSRVRCITAAAAITSAMKAVCHIDLGSMNPFIAFCLYVAARVFVQYIKARPGDQQAHGSLQFLLSAMQALKRKNPLTESFLVQLDVDLESAGFSGSGTKQRPWTGKYGEGGSEENLFSFIGKSKEAATKPAIQHGTFGDQGLATYTMPSRPASVNKTRGFTSQAPESLANGVTSSLNIENEFTRFQSGSATTGTSNASYAQYTSANSASYDATFYPDTIMEISGGSSNDQATTLTSNSSAKGSSSYTPHSSPGNQTSKVHSLSQSPPEETINGNSVSDEFFRAAGLENFTSLDGSMYPSPPSMDQEYNFLSPGTVWESGGSGLTPGVSATVDSGDNNAWLGMIDDPGSWGMDTTFGGGVGQGLR